MSKLDKMRERINNLKDPEMLEVARDLLNEMAEVQRLKEQIELRESKFTEGKRAAFYFFAQGLEPEELSLAASTVNGRLRFIGEQIQRESASAIRDSESADKPAPTKPHSYSHTFGGLGSSFEPKNK